MDFVNTGQRNQILDKGCVPAMTFWTICKINLTTFLAVLLRSYGGSLQMLLSLFLIVLLAGVALLVQGRTAGLTVGLGFPAAEAKCPLFSTKCETFLVLSTQILSMKLTDGSNFGGQECRRT